MFYPGDPTEERKRELIRKLMSGRNASGRRTGRAPGFAGFARGMGFGGVAPFAGGRGVAVAPALLAALQEQSSNPNPIFSHRGDNPGPPGPILGPPPNTPVLPPQPPALIQNTPDLFQRVSQYGRLKAY